MKSNEETVLNEIDRLQKLLDQISGNLDEKDKNLHHEIKETREYLIDQVKIAKIEINKIADEAKKMLDERPPPPPLFKMKDKKEEKVSNLKRPEPEKLSAGQIKKVEEMLESRLEKF